MQSTRAVRSKGFSIWPITESMDHPCLLHSGRAWPSSDPHLFLTVLGLADSKQELAIEQRMGIPKSQGFLLDECLSLLISEF